MGLEALCRDAQKSELEPGNTSAGFFLFLALIQMPFIVACASLLDGDAGTFLVAGWIGMLGHWLGFAKSEILGTDKWFDVTEDVTYIAVFCKVYTSIASPSHAQNVIFACAFLWLFRLVGFLGYRIVVVGSDWRFDKLITNRAYNLFGWTSGGTWCFLNGFCLWVLADADTGTGALSAVTWLGLLIFAAGLATEFVSDVQKYRFSARHVPGTKKTWIDEGLWSVSRHPNYLGEISLWLGLAVAVIGAIPNPSVAQALLCLVSPVWSGFFLFFTSLMLLEKRGEKRWGEDKGFQAYRNRTPILFPIHL